MMLVKTKLLYSPIHGLGCFADEDIKKGQTVWELNPKVDLTFTQAEYNQFPESFQLFLRKHCYSPIYETELLYVLCADHTRHLNHSEDPNLSETDVTTFANRDIKKGEELTCDYFSFDKEADYKLGLKS